MRRNEMGQAMSIEEEYKVCFKDREIGRYWIYEDGSARYYGSGSTYKGMEDVPEALRKDARSGSRIPFFRDLMAKENRVLGTRKTAYRRGDVSVTRVPKDVDSFRIYRRGTADDDKEDHSAPHCEGSGPIEGMREWASWYCINKKDDGTFEAELDEAWWWGGGHNDGGTMREEVPEGWLDLPYDELLENLVTLVRARHYGFTAEHLRRKKGLREFLGFCRRLLQTNPSSRHDQRGRSRG
ncbi:MAG: hypothetical protein IKQ60_02620 [Candidatus Methanomethylophilaceae archaeon]|nr:hypothetical protein [Candidatus Methanomethylophilaceae archaeon]